MPSGAPSLIFALAMDWLTGLAGPSLEIEERGAPALVVTPRTEYEVVATADFARLAGVHFQPWGLRAFFPETEEIVRCSGVDLEAIWANEARVLRERLRNARSPEALFAELERALIRKLRPFPGSMRLSAAVNHLQRNESAIVVSQTAAMVECSERQLHRVFTAHLGLSPKQYFRVRRFRRALHIAARQVHVDWVDLALHCGYADQSHFVREFRAFSGVNPTTYFAKRGAWAGHLPVEAGSPSETTSTA